MAKVTNMTIKMFSSTNYSAWFPLTIEIDKLIQKKKEKKKRNPSFRKCHKNLKATRHDSHNYFTHR